MIKFPVDIYLVVRLLNHLVAQATEVKLDKWNLSKENNAQSYKGSL
jgi:hypothetical protein